MAFPVAADSATSGNQNSVSPHVVDVPPRNADDVILIYYAAAGGDGSAPSDLGGVSWTLLASEGGGANSVWWLRAANSTGSSVTFTTSFASQFAAVAVRVTGADGTVNVEAAEAEATDNPPAFNPSWGVEDTLWLAGYSDVQNGVNATPTNYTLVASINPFDVAAVAERSAAVASQDPSSWSADFSGFGLATTVAVPPVGVAPPNTAPTADAGPDQTVQQGDLVNLDGTGSTDPEDGSAGLSYEWTVANDGGTGLTNADITGRLTSTPSFTAPNVSATSNIILQLQVTDTGALSDTDTVTVTVEPIVSMSAILTAEATLTANLRAVRKMSATLTAEATLTAALDLLREIPIVPDLTPPPPRAFNIRVRDGDRNNVGTVGAPLAFEAILRHNAVSNWTASLDADEPVTAKLVPGAGIRLFDQNTGRQILSGPLSPIQESRGGEQGGDPDVGGANEGPGGVLTVSGEDDTIVLSRRLVHPDPTVTLGATATTGLSHYQVSGVAETVLRDLVNVNAGPGALTHRHVPGLVLVPDGGRGSNVEDQFRFAELMTALHDLALVGGVGFHVLQSGTDLEFQVYVPADLSGTARYSLGLGNLNSYSFEIRPPSVTDVIVGAGGEGTAREFYRFTRLDPVWPDIRVEQFADRRDLDPAAADTPAKAEQEANERLDEGAGVAKIAFEPIDTPRLRLFRDVNLGDKVKLELTRTSLVEVIREIRIVLTEDEGWKAVPVIGADNATSTPQIYKTVGRLVRRIHALEVSR